MKQIKTQGVLHLQLAKTQVAIFSEAHHSDSMRVNSITLVLQGGA
jgi:hypothetical protein